MKQVQFSSKSISHSEHLRQVACHSRSGETLNRNSSIIGCWQPKQIFSSEISELGEVELSVGELEPDPAWCGGVLIIIDRVMILTKCVLNAQGSIKTDWGQPRMWLLSTVMGGFRNHAVYSLKCRLTLQTTWELTTATTKHKVPSWQIPHQYENYSVCVR